MIVVNGKIYERCGDCGKIVRLNKPFFGSSHFCLSKEEKRARRNAGLRFQPLDDPTQRDV